MVWNNKNCLLAKSPFYINTLPHILLIKNNDNGNQLFQRLWKKNIQTYLTRITFMWCDNLSKYSKTRCFRCWCSYCAKFGSKIMGYCLRVGSQVMGYVTWRGYRYTSKSILNMTVHSKTNFAMQTHKMWSSFRFVYLL